MIRDVEGNAIHLSKKPNPHIMVLGSSGYGKTFFLCRRMEELIEEGKTIFLLDYSSSYTESELKKNNFRYLETAHILNPLDANVELAFRGQNLISNLTDVMVRTLKVCSYYQKRLLKKAINLEISSKEIFTIPLLMTQLEELLNIEEDTESKKNLLHLLTRIEPYLELSGIQFLAEKFGRNGEEKSKITIVQLSDYAEIQRKFCVEFLSEIFWKETRYSMKRADVIVLDEFQNLNMKPGSALSCMLREGRKFGLSVCLSSQFIANSNKEETDTLMQAANKIFFRPTEKDVKSVADLFDQNDRKTWKNILKRLQVGEFVLMGRYSLNRNKREIETPIICQIE